MRLHSSRYAVATLVGIWDYEQGVMSTATLFVSHTKTPNTLVITSGCINTQSCLLVSLEVAARGRKPLTQYTVTG